MFISKKLSLLVGFIFILTTCSYIYIYGFSSPVNAVKQETTTLKFICSQIGNGSPNCRSTDKRPTKYKSATFSALDKLYLDVNGKESPPTHTYKSELIVDSLTNENGTDKGKFVKGEKKELKVSYFEVKVPKEQEKNKFNIVKEHKMIAQYDASITNEPKPLQAMATLDKIYSGSRAVGSKAFDILIISAGFGSSGMSTYINASNQFEELPNDTFYDQYSDRINIMRLQNTDSFSSLGCTNDGSGYYWCDNESAIQQYASQYNADKVVIIINSSNMGGVTLLNFPYVHVGYNNSGMNSNVGVHELGHALCGLWDEYVYGGGRTDSGEGANCKYSCSSFPSGMGCFNGCTDTNHYRATEYTRMKNVSYPFDKIGLAECKKAFLKYAPDGAGTPTPTKVPTPTPTKTPTKTPTATPTSTTGLSVTFTKPTDGDVVSDTVEIKTSAKSSARLSSHTIAINNIEVASCSSSKTCSYDWDTIEDEAQDGNNTIKATVKDVNGKTASATITVRVNNNGGGDEPSDGTLAKIAIAFPYTFKWYNMKAQQYYLDLGTTKGAYDLFEKTVKGTTYSTSISKANIKSYLAKDQDVYVRLWTKLSNQWNYVDYVFSNTKEIGTNPGDGGSGGDGGGGSGGDGGSGGTTGIPKGVQACLNGVKVPDKGVTWTSSNGLLDVLGQVGYTAKLKRSGQYVDGMVPATVLAGLLTWENPDLIKASKSEIDRIVKPGEIWEKYCSENYASAAGPFQFTSGAWSNYGDAIMWAKAAGVDVNRPSGYTPNRCNLLDSAYAAAAFLKDSFNKFKNAGTSCERYKETEPSDYNWTRNNIIQATCHFYGATGNSVCASVDADNNGTADGNMCYSNRAVYYSASYTCK